MNQVIKLSEALPTSGMGHNYGVVNAEEMRSAHAGAAELTHEPQTSQEARTIPIQWNTVPGWRIQKLHSHT